MIDSDEFLRRSNSLIVRAYNTNDTALMIRTVSMACQLKLMRAFVTQLQNGRTHDKYVLRCSRHNKCLATLHLGSDNRRSFLLNSKWYSTIDELLQSNPSECRVVGCDVHNMELGAYSSMMVDSPVLMNSINWKSAISIFPALLNDSDLTVEFIETWIWAFIGSKIK